MDGCQITGACSSYARKYALNALLMIDDSKDSDDDSLSPKNPANQRDVELPPPVSDSKPFTPPNETAKAEVATIENAFKSCMEDFMAMFGISDSKEALKKFNSFRKSLQDGGVIPKHDKMLDAHEVADTFDAIYRNFKPSGEKNERTA